jgi:hypothetical protein
MIVGAGAQLRIARGGEVETPEAADGVDVNGHAVIEIARGTEGAVGGRNRELLPAAHLIARLAVET